LGAISLFWAISTAAESGVNTSLTLARSGAGWSSPRAGAASDPTLTARQAGKTNRTMIRD